MLFILLLAVAAFVYATWQHVSQLDRAIAGLSRRVGELEQSRTGPLPAAPPAPVAVAAKPSSVPPPIIPGEPEQGRLEHDRPEQVRVTASAEAAAVKKSDHAGTITREPEQVRLTASAEATAVKKPDSTSLEAQIGSNWLLYIGVVVIVIGVSYFEKLAIDSGWIGETARVVQGAVAGLVMVYAGIRFVRAGYSIYGQMLAGGGAAVLYVAIYAAFNLYYLIGRPVAFGLMAAITTMSAWLADRHRSQGLALAAVGGGFATPFLLPSRIDAQIALFTYEAVLIAGTMYLAHRRAWPVLNAVSYVFTLLTVLAWAVAHYAAHKYLATELFLTLFCAMYLYLLRENRRSPLALARVVESVLWTAPVAYYLASLAILFPHSVALLVFLLAFSVAGVAISVRTTPLTATARLPILFAVVVPLMQWIGGHPASAWLMPGLVTVAGVYAIHLLAHFEVTRRKGHALSPVDVAIVHLNGLTAFGGAYGLIDVVNSTATASTAAVFALWHGAIAYRLCGTERDHALHFAALAFTLLTIAIAIQLDGVWITIGWAAEGAAIMWLGLREQRHWLRAGGLVVFSLAVITLLDLQFAQPTLDQMVVFNRRAACGAFVIALVYLTAWFHRRRNTARQYSTEIAVALVSAQLLTLSLLTSEIGTLWGLRLASDAWPSGTNDGRFVRELLLSITWAAYATGLIVVGIRKRYAPLRYTAFAVFAVTIVKVFAVDLARLDRIYRVSSILGLGVMLLLTSFLYHRFRGRLDQAEEVRN